MRYRFLVVVAAAACAAPAGGEPRVETVVDVDELRAVPLEQPAPAFPGGTRTGQEGWVRVHFVVTPDGRVTDPIVIDSIGGAPFEEAVLEALARWRFEPAPDGSEITNNVVDMRFELVRGRDAATSNFLRRFRRIMADIVGEQTAQARTQLDETAALGGWNLYESTMLALMSGRLADQEGSAFGKLEYYRRALAVDTGSAVQGRDRRELLARIFEIEYGAGQYSAALATADALAAEPGGTAELDALAAPLAEMRAALADGGNIVARARLASPCDCADGEGLWQYQPTRKRFAFAKADRGVRRFEARCDAWRLKGDIDPASTHVIPEGSRNCRVFVFGADGAEFEFVESAGRRDATAAASAPATGSG